jgi:hypothetical protein
MVLILEFNLFDIVEHVDVEELAQILILAFHQLEKSVE